MAQMLLEQPMKAAIRIGYNCSEYSELEQKLHEVREKIAPEMRRIVRNYEDDSSIRKIILDGIPKEGSYHRGSLIAISSGATGGKEDISLAAAGELFYWATAWLDDIADDNTFRQTAQSVRKSTNDSVAMYASNVLYGIVMRSITDQFRNTPLKLANILDHFFHNFHIINKGQARDMLLAQKSLSDVSTQDYISLIEETTGVDVATNLALGGISAGLDEETQQNLYGFGLKLGTLAQIRDDVLDYCDAKDSEGNYVIGKLPFRDSETGKKRLPLLLTRDVNMRRIPDEVYDRIEKDFITERRNEAERYLNKANINGDSKKLLNGILKYWSDIRLFQRLTSG